MANYGGFEVYSKSVGISSLTQRRLGIPNNQFNANDALAYDAYGRLGPVTATGKASHAFINVQTVPPLLRPATTNLTTLLGEPILAVPCAGNGLLFKTPLVGNSAPTKNLLACNANATLNTIIFADAGGTTGDLLGGQIYIPNLFWQSPILTDTVTAGVRTVTILTTINGFSLPRAVTTGDSIIAVPWSAGFTGVKFNGTVPSQGVDTSITGKSGGNVNIEEVYLGTYSQNLITALGAGTGYPAGVPYIVVSFPVYATT